MHDPIAPAALEVLAGWDTPTICNALEIVTPERRTTGFTTGHMVCLAPDARPIVGYARTATIRAVTPSPLDPAQLRELRLAYYEHVASPPGPTIAVLQDLDPEPGFGAFWGEVNTTVHRGLGCLGAVTNGSIRDLDACASGFQLIAGKVGPSHAHVHVVDFGRPVNIFGMAVASGDIVHADRHGAVVIPAPAVAELPAAVELLSRREAVVISAASKPGFDIVKLRAAYRDQADIH